MSDQGLKKRGQPKLRRRRRRTTPYRSEKFTKKTRTIIYKALRQRLPISTVCKYACIDEKTFHEWMERGSWPIQTSRLSPRYNQEHVGFRNRVNKIMKEVEEESLRIIKMAEVGGQTFQETKVRLGGKYGKEITKITKELHPNWHAAAWFLERTRPKEYNPAVMVRSGEDKDANELAQAVWAALRAMDETVPQEETEGQ